LGTATTVLVSESTKLCTILLVDDQGFVGMAVGRLLQGEADLKLDCCLNAEEAVARAAETAPALILQDLVMPGLDGFSLVRQYRQNPVTARTPIIVLSANDDVATRERALDAGATDYLVKLPPKADLIACVRRHLSAAGSASAAPAAAAPGAVDPVLDLGVIADFCGSNLDDAAAFVLILVGQFMNETEAELKALQFASDNDDRALLRLAVHRLKGGAATMGARRLAAVCGQLEDELGRPGRPTPHDLVQAAIEETTRAREACGAIRKRYEPNP